MVVEGFAPRGIVVPATMVNEAFPTAVLLIVTVGNVTLAASTDALAFVLPSKANEPEVGVWVPPVTENPAVQ